MMKKLIDSNQLKVVYFNRDSFACMSGRKLLLDLPNKQLVNALDTFKKKTNDLKINKMLLDLSSCYCSLKYSGEMEGLKKILTRTSKRVQNKIALVVSGNTFDEIYYGGFSLPESTNQQLQIQYYDNMDAANNWLGIKKQC